MVPIMLILRLLQAKMGLRQACRACAGTGETAVVYEVLE